MQVGLVGLGRMGQNMAERMRSRGHDVVGYDLSPESPRDVSSLTDLISELVEPRVVWVMLPHGKPTIETIANLKDLLTEGDVVVDGGNSPFTDDETHATLLRERGIGYVDVGVSGGVWGKAEGYALMVGGSDTDFARILPLLEALKPEGDSGLVHAGPVGAGHFAKMVHNGIEYGMMQAFGEGYEMLQACDLIKHPDDVIASWQSGSVVRSWLLDLLVLALEADPELSQIAGTAPDSGEARWMIEAGLNLAVPLPVTTASLFARFASRKNQPPTMQVVAAMREQFGGHASTRRTA